MGEHVEAAGEGWFRDPFGLHTDRWVSNGKSTSLVRVDGVESTDPPPEGGESDHDLVRSAAGKGSADDIRRADDQLNDRHPSHPSYADAVYDAYPQITPGAQVYRSPRRSR